MTKSTTKAKRNGDTKTGTTSSASTSPTTVKGSNKSDKKGKGDDIKIQDKTSPTNGKIKNRPPASVKPAALNEVQYKIVQSHQVCLLKPIF